ncbi:MAG: hypothetical protein J7641_21015 [Cyanobacteria bacterium SID2]|nr:hypothetical protein [Cyanobacteria bacterium SID2]MBP0006409.1 hypothetical protein [Cyanobacteria bacterium SBC]
MTIPIPPRTRAQESRAAIERLYVVMRHLFVRGHYRPGGVSGQSLVEAIQTLQPEIYGSISDPEKVELDGLAYVIERLPRGIEMCRFIKLIAAEGYKDSGFETIVPGKRRRNCYRIDEETMPIEVTRGRSEIYDILTHLTFLHVEAEKIKEHALEDGRPTREWLKLEKTILGEGKVDRTHSMTIEDPDLRDRAFSYLSTLLGRTFEETVQAYHRFAEGSPNNNSLFHIIYWLGRNAMDAKQPEQAQQIVFSPTLRERIGHHIHGEKWANDVKAFLMEKNLWERPLHVISANLHSVLNSLFAFPLLGRSTGMLKTIESLALELSQPKSARLNREVREFANQHGMDYLEDRAGTNIHVQIFDTSRLPFDRLSPQIHLDREWVEREKPVLLVMDYAFGEQAFEIMDELLKPYKIDGVARKLDVRSISMLGKAGILVGNKGDLMIPTAHVFEGTADNYPIDNDFSIEDFKDFDIPVFEGAMVTVLGTSLQNADILEYFKSSSWNAIGLEMEGAHLQKAIQAASKIRKSIDENVTLRYAYYASDNPLLTGSTLASGSLGQTGVKPTYAITLAMLKKILGGTHRNLDLQDSNHFEI